MSGPVGLDYNALYPIMDRMDLSKEEWRAMLDDIRTLEGGALSSINSKQ